MLDRLGYGLVLIFLNSLSLLTMVFQAIPNLAMQVRLSSCEVRNLKITLDYVLNTPQHRDLCADCCRLLPACLRCAC